jgi:hypothetical protein
MGKLFSLSILYLIYRFTFAGNESHRELAISDCVKWGNTFDVPLVSKNVMRDCKLPDGRAVCCAAVDPPSYEMFYKPVGYNYNPFARKSRKDDNQEGIDNCHIKKVYISSPQELRDIAIADLISLISSDHTDPQRFSSLMRYVLSEEVQRNATKMLDRIKYHMSVDAVSEKMLTRDDYEYLSRFEATKVCGGKEEMKWIEWIEPITITMRHPFSFAACKPVRPLLTAETAKAGRSNVDYVLLQSGKALFDNNYNANTGKRFRRDITAGQSSSSSASNRKQKNAQIRHFMLDAGTSTFDSSLFWFLCGYSQVSVNL